MMSRYVLDFSVSMIFCLSRNESVENGIFVNMK